MTYKDWIAMLTAVREDTRARLESNDLQRSMSRQFGLTEEEAVRARLTLNESFTIASQVLPPDILVVQYFSIGVDMGIKLAEAQALTQIFEGNRA